MPSALPFTADVLNSFRPTKTLRHHQENAVIGSIDFDDNGLHCLTTSQNDESIQLYDCKTGKHLKTVYSKKYGVSIARFTHNTMNCVYASTKEDDTIRYLSLHDYSYIRYFKGHKGRVTGLEVSPVNDMFLSSSYDHSVRVWDLRSAACQGLLNIPAPSLIAFDATAMVFAVASQNLSIISLYNVKMYDQGPFLSWKTTQVPSSQTWTKIEFSNNGKWLALATSEHHYLFDSYTGEYQATMVVPVPLPKRDFSCSMAFTVDGSYVVGGAGDNKVHFWKCPDRNVGDVQPTFSIPSNSPAQLLAFSPKTMLMATADKDLTLWLPEQAA